MINLSAAVLDPMLGTDAVRPRITYYDDATGERIELSAATLANWAAKTGNLLRDELGAGPAGRVAVLLPAHWQTAAVLFGVWWIGAEVVLGGPGIDADVALCTAGRIAEADDAVGAGGEVAVLSLDPFGQPAPDLPIGVTDYATAVRVHGDQIDPELRPGPALAGRSTDEILTACEDSAATQGLTSTDRVLSTTPWIAAAGELIGGALIGLAIGWLFAKASHRNAPSSSGLFSIGILAVAVLAYATASLAHTSGFIAVYLASLVLGNSNLPHGCWAVD